MSKDSKQNNKDFFELLFKDYSDVIYRLCLYKTSDESVAHDLVQETFLRLWRIINSEREIEKPKQYIYQIARNLILDYYKSKKTLSLDLLQEKGYEPKSNENSQELQSEVFFLKQVIESLDEEFKDVMYMKFIEEIKVKDISEILGISENLVSVRINRGKKKIKDIFE